MVDKNPRMSKIMNLHFLQNALRGQAADLIQQVQFTPSAYEELKEALVEAFEDKESAIKELQERVRTCNVVKKDDNKQLSVFVGFATGYVIQLMQIDGGRAFNPSYVFHDFHSKLNSSLKTEWNRDMKQKEFIRRKLSDQQKVSFLISFLKEQR